MIPEGFTVTRPTGTMTIKPRSEAFPRPDVPVTSFKQQLANAAAARASSSKPVSTSAATPKLKVRPAPLLASPFTPRAKPLSTSALPSRFTTPLRPPALAEPLESTSKSKLPLFKTPARTEPPKTPPKLRPLSKTPLALATTPGGARDDVHDRLASQIVQNSRESIMQDETMSELYRGMGLSPQKGGGKGRKGSMRYDLYLMLLN